MRQLLPLALTTFGVLAPATLAAPQDPAPRGKLERRDARADSGSSRSTGGETKTWRRVVKDGEVIEEEGTPLPEWERLLGDSWRPETCDPAKLLEELRRGLEREGLGELPPGFGGLPPGFGELPKGEKSSSSSSHTRRVVVVNGETVVDEELRDGVPVRPARGAAVPPPGLGSRPLPGRSEARAEARADAHAEASESSSSSGSESSDSSGSSSGSSKRDAGRSKDRSEGSRPVLPDGSGRFRVGEPSPARPLPPRSPEPKSAPSRARTSSPTGDIR
ncbi:MAG: hypothetical protein JNM84_14825 [Planctomycetes bacterium]|nr:hypothetical protein [Planctomycetota bacterium]